MRNFRTDGIIIKRRNFGEADRILTVFTKNFGKIQIKAKGVRRITSRRASHIELLNLSSISLYKGRGSLPILLEAQCVKDFFLIKEDLTRIGFSYHLCELIDGLCAENQESRSIFYLFENTLERLCLEKDIAVVIHEFEIQLLTTLGFYKGSFLQRSNISVFIEHILEKKLKTRQILPQLL